MGVLAALSKVPPCQPSHDSSRRRSHHVSRRRRSIRVGSCDPNTRPAGSRGPNSQENRHRDAFKSKLVNTCRILSGSPWKERSVSFIYVVRGDGGGQSVLDSAETAGAIFS